MPVEFFPQLAALAPVATRKNYEEFLATVSTYKIIRANDMADAIGHLFQDDIADQMSVAVVDGFKVIQVQHQNAC